jgi:hydrogenase maturation protease
LIAELGLGIVEYSPAAPSPVFMILLIGYGNPLRSDDGVGRKVVEQVAGAAPAWLLSEGLQIIACHQLLPEHAELIAGAERVVFVDAAIGEPGTVEVREVEADAALGDGRFHDFTPSTLLAYAERLYGHRPPAELVTIGGFSFEHGEALSLQMARLLPQITERVLGLLER